MTPELVTDWALALMLASMSAMVAVLFCALCIGILVSVLKK